MWKLPLTWNFFFKRSIVLSPYSTPDHYFTSVAYSFSITQCMACYYLSNAYIQQETEESQEEMRGEALH